MKSLSFLLSFLSVVAASNNNFSSVYFQERGDIFVAYDVIHLVIQLDLTPIEQQCQYFRETIKASLPHYKEVVQLEDLWFTAAHLVKQTCDLQHFHSHAQHVVKRQAMFGLAAVIGTVFGIYSFAKIQSMSARIQGLERSHVDDLHLLQHQESRQRLIERDMLAVNTTLSYLNRNLGRQADNVGKIFWMQSFVQQFGLVQHHIQALNDGWAALLTQKFPVLWMLPKAALPVYRAKRAEKNGRGVATST